MVSKSDFGSLLDNGTTTTIASSQQISDVIEVLGMTLLGIRVPAAFTGTSVNIQESSSISGPFQDVYNTSGNLMSFAVAASRTILFNPADLAGLSYIKLKSSSTEASERTISCIMRVL